MYQQISTVFRRMRDAGLAACSLCSSGLGPAGKSGSGLRPAGDPDPCMQCCISDNAPWEPGSVSDPLSSMGRTDRQPHCSMRGGATRRPSRLPTFRPLKMKEVARERSLLEMTRDTMSVAAAGATPSPRPTSAREKHSPVHRPPEFSASST